VNAAHTAHCTAKRSIYPVGVTEQWTYHSTLTRPNSFARNITVIMQVSWDI